MALGSRSLCHACSHVCKREAGPGRNPASGRGWSPGGDARSELRVETQGPVPSLGAGRAQVGVGLTCLSPQAGWTLLAAAAAPWPGMFLGWRVAGGGVVCAPLSASPPPLSAAGPCSAAWPSCGRPGRGGAGRSRNTACTTTASAGATAASTAPTSTTLRRWPCAPGEPGLQAAGWRGSVRSVHLTRPQPSSPSVRIGFSGARARRRTGPAPSPTRSPRRR